MNTSGDRGRQSGGECTQGGIHTLERFVRLDKVCVHHFFRELLVVFIELKYLVEHFSVDDLIRGIARHRLKGCRRAREQATVGRRAREWVNFQHTSLAAGGGTLSALVAGGVLGGINTGDAL